MKTIVLFVGLICTLCLFQTINAATAVEEPVEAQLPGVEAQPLSVLSRQKRATCDLLSFFGVNCPAHCILLGYRGGYCNERGICECRK